MICLSFCLFQFLSPSYFFSLSFFSFSTYLSVCLFILLSFTLSFALLQILSVAQYYEYNNLITLSIPTSLCSLLFSFYFPLSVSLFLLLSNFSLSLCFYIVSIYPKRINVVICKLCHGATSTALRVALSDLCCRCSVHITRADSIGGTTVSMQHVQMPL